MPASRLALALCALVVGSAIPGFADGPDRAKRRAAARELLQQGQRKEAYDLFVALCAEEAAPAAEVAEDLTLGCQCLAQLQRLSELDAFREAVLAKHGANHPVPYAAALAYLQYDHRGTMVAGEFQRGPRRGGGQPYNAWERDRIRALQLFEQARTHADAASPAQTRAAFHLAYAEALLMHRGQRQTWRLQYKTDLAVLPDYEPGYGYYYGGGQLGAPVDVDGNAVFHALPKDLEAAATDGQRWRWLLLQAMELDPANKHRVLSIIADFAHQQFDVHTMAYHAPSSDDQTGPFAVGSLAEDETIARLANGIKRFKLPADYDFIKLYRELGAHAQLAQIFENRRQYPKAAEQWKLAGQADRVAQIVNPWCRFDGAQNQPAGVGAKVGLTFRNGKRVELVAQEIDLAQLIDDVKAYLASNPPQLDWNHVNVEAIGWRLVNEDARRYLKGKVAEWALDVEPRANHADRRVDVATPVQKAGAFLLSARIADGNTAKCVLWISDLVIARKPLDKAALHYVADAVTGAPVPGAQLEFFGYRQRWEQDGRRYQITTRVDARTTDEQGMAIVKGGEMPTDHNYLITARTKDGRLAFLGFSGLWVGQHHDATYNATKVFAITDRPVYRPKHSVKYKLWVRHARYDQDGADFAGKSFTLKIVDAMGQAALEREVTCDGYGGIDGDFPLAADAKLGSYQLGLWRGDHFVGGGGFQVEEYKKPEFEVTVAAPAEPVMLGDKVQAKVKATYYFGAPVAKGTLKYKVLRYSHDARWYPSMPWDWFYGPGYWWYASDYTWYPGFERWGCFRPTWWWWGGRHVQPELVAEGEAALGPDGTYALEIDTALAKSLHGDLDHRYEVTIEVTDESRRTIVGTGQVLVARQPFKVYGWIDRGHYQVGDTVTAHFAARRLDGVPVTGKGELSLLAITYVEGKPVEAVVQRWDLAPDADGRARQQIAASQAGQYRLAYTVTDAKGNAIEGGYVFVIRGKGFDGRAFRFNALELVPDKAEYAPGEKVKLMINTDRVGGTVLFFPRAANGSYTMPQVLKLDGKSTQLELDIALADMPNCFVEALTIADGKLHSETRELVVPPASRVLGVEVLPSATEYKPGQEAKVRVKLTDADGKPFVGQTALAVYDHALDYIAGGSRAGDIKSFYWKWRRHHRPANHSSLDRHGYPINKQGEAVMRVLGIFGGLDDSELELADKGEQGGGERLHSLRKGAAPTSADANAPAGAPAAPMESAEGGRAGGKMMEAKADGGGGGGGGAPEAAAVVRKSFADTAYWNAAAVTDANGETSVTFKMPENLSGWTVNVWAMGSGTRVGQGSATVTTKKNLLVRLQAPRFFVEKDEVVLSANVHNYLAAKKSVRVVLELDGPCLAASGSKESVIEIDSMGEARVDWRVTVAREGTAVVRMKAYTDEESDAMEMSFPAYVHGMDKMIARSASIRPDATKTSMRFDVPAQRRIDASRLEVRYSPTLAGAMVDALPYLVSYPYGCTEQTLSRFLPTVITQKILMEMGIDLAAVKAKRTNLNAQELGDAGERAAQWKRYQHNPVFDQAEVAKMTADGIAQLAAMQCADGGWGWFSGYGERSWPHTTAYVVHGLQVARECDLALPAGMLERGLAWLVKYQAEQIALIERAPAKVHPYKEHADDLDAFVHMCLVDAKQPSVKMRDFLYRDRLHLAVYGMSMLALALHAEGGQADALAMVKRNIEQFLVTDDENQTSYLKLGNGAYWWCWYGSEHEAHAYYLKLLAKVEPKGETARRLVKYLLNNRKHASYWSSTRDTAICVEAMADYLKASGESTPDMTVEVWVNGQQKKSVKITSENLFTFDGTVTVVGDAVETGALEVELRRVAGEGPVYANAYLGMFTLEDRIEKAGLEVKVERRYYKLVRVETTEKVAGSRGQVVEQRVEKLERRALEHGSELVSGDLVEVELVIESKNDYEYLCFEDPKAAGFEAHQVRSGYVYGNLWAYMELRDAQVSFFVRALPRGTSSVSYRLRAEIPGKFAALPAKAHAMYAPELRANSDELALGIVDKK